MKFISNLDKEMSNGMRNMSRTPLTEEEIKIVKKEIQRIEADESIFVFNDPDHVAESTCYNFKIDRVFVTRNVFPDTRYASTHPRDIMSIGAVLAHEYYGHRRHRDEYIHDFQMGNGFHTTPIWQDECRASIEAARFAPNLTDLDKSNLIMDAVYRAEEYGQYIEMDSFMKEVLYGYSDEERNITNTYTGIVFVSKKSTERNRDDRRHNSCMSEMRDETDDFEDIER